MVKRCTIVMMQITPLILKIYLSTVQLVLKKTATNEFFDLDTSRSVEEREFEISGTNQLSKRRAGYNKGFALRKALLGIVYYLIHSKH